MSRQTAWPSALRLRRRVAAILVGAAVLALLTVPKPEQTEAAWADSEVARGSSFTSITVPAPIATAQCTLAPGLLGATPKVTVYWRIPTGDPQFTSDDAELVNPDGSLVGALTTLLLGNSVTNTGTPGAYTLVIGDGLLGGLLGSSKVMRLRLNKGGWTGPELTITATMGALGANPKCVVSPAP